VAFGSLTSQRGDRVLIDDPHSTDTVESELERGNTARRFRERAIFSINDPERSAVVVIMQRLHEEDISGVILKYGMDFVHLRLPMEFEADNRCETILGIADIRVADGELLDPERATPSYIEKLKRDTTSYTYAGQFQQRPAPREGGMFKRAWFGIMPAAPAGLQKVRSWDLAATDGGGDQTVGLLMGKDASGFFYILDVIRLRGSAHDVEQTIVSTAKLDGRAVKVRIPQDPGQAGKGQVEYLTRQLSGYIVVTERETGSKETRAMPLASQCEARFFGVAHIARMPHPALYKWLNRGIFQTPGRIEVIYAAKLPTFEFIDIARLVAARAGIDPPMVPHGSPSRARSSFAKRRWSPSRTRTRARSADRIPRAPWR
jgi:predicted phage terminase large subunit-like protein